MLAIIIALILPAFITLWITRVTFNQFVGPILTLVIMLAIFSGFSQPIHLQIITVFSVIVGWFLAKRIWSKK